MTIFLTRNEKNDAVREEKFCLSSYVYAWVLQIKLTKESLTRERSFLFISTCMQNFTENVTQSGS